MKILMKFEVEKDLPGVDDPEEAELIAKEIAYYDYRWRDLKYTGMSMGPELDYQMAEIKEMGRMWDELINVLKHQHNESIN